MKTLELTAGLKKGIPVSGCGSMERAGSGKFNSSLQYFVTRE